MSTTERRDEQIVPFEFLRLLFVAAMASTVISETESQSIWFGGLIIFGLMILMARSVRQHPR